MIIEYNNLYTHFILITKNRIPLIAEQHRIQIEKYITGIVKNHHSKLYSIYANPEHVHLIASRSPKICEETLLSRIAIASADFINENKFCQGHFEWQQSASAFSVSKSDVNRVCKYILRQAEHHKKVTFEMEYNDFLEFYQSTLKWDIN